MTAARRIHLIGTTGSGKTFAAGVLFHQLNIPTFGLDELYWDRAATTYGVRANPETRDRQLLEIVGKDAWIIEGVYHDWLGPSFDRADIIVAMVPSVFVRDARVVRRFVRRKFGQSLAKRESLRDLWNLLRWNHGYDGDNYPRAIAYIKSRGRGVVECRQVSDVLEAVTRGPS